MTSNSRALLAEFLGTLLLVSTVVGSGIMATNLTSDAGLALLINTVATVLVLWLLITLMAPISGAHFNPAVSLVFLIQRQIGAAKFVRYSLAQALGAVCGAALANLMFGLEALKLSQTERILPGTGLAEVVATAGLLLTILLLIRQKQTGLVPAAVAAWIGAAYFFTSSTSFANPAVTLGRMFSDTFAGVAPLSGAWFMGLQVVGALLGLLLFQLLAGKGVGSARQKTKPNTKPKTKPNTKPKTKEGAAK